MQEKYLEQCRDNAIRKKKLELELLLTKSASLPIESSTFENYVFFNSFPGTLESNELVMEWLRDCRLGANPKKMLIHQISSHEGFVALYALNSLRKSKNPNFLYYHGVVQITEKDEDEDLLAKKQLSPGYVKYDSNATFYALTEDLFLNEEDEDMFNISFREVCETENWTTILSYYISLLLSLNNANKDLMYANYDLNLDNIMMKYMGNAIFDVEYNLNDFNIWITNYGYVPTITRFSKSYVKIMVENMPKSFGYNNISQIPFESKGIYCDRGFVISDAYALLMCILEVLYVKNIEAYEKIKILASYFIKDEPSKLFGKRHFMPYFAKTEKLNMEEYIKFVYKNFEEIISFKPKNDVLKCIGYKLKIESRKTDFYSVKNLIQLYDFIKYYSFFITEDNQDVILKVINLCIEDYNKLYQKESFSKELDRLNQIEENLSHKSVVFEIPDNLTILSNPKYSNILINYINYCIVYFNTWERLKMSIKITEFLDNIHPIIKDINYKYKEIYENNKDYYETVYQNLTSFRSIFRKRMNLYSLYKNQILYLETLE